MRRSPAMPQAVSASGVLLVVLMGAAIGGCVQEKKTIGPGGQPIVRQTNVTQVPQGNPNANFVGDPIGIDPCAARLQAIEGQLIAYYSLYKRMPERLDELKEFASFEQVPSYTCPVTGRPYVYNPAGLEASGQTYRLYVYDEVPHNGKRNVIVIRPPVPGQPLLSDVASLSDAQ